MSDRTDRLPNELEIECPTWHELDIDLLRTALRESGGRSDEWWQKYKKERGNEDIPEVGKTSYVSAKLDDRWGTEFSATGWRTVEHFEQ